MTAARAEYLFDLACVCHIPPAAVDELRIADFGNLTLHIDAMAEGD